MGAKRPARCWCTARLDMISYGRTRVPGTGYYTGYSGTIPDHVLASHTTFFNFQVHRSDFVHVTTRTSHDDGFIEIGAGFIVHGFSLFPARRFLIMDFRAGYSSTGEPQKITMYSPGRRRQFYNFIVSNGTFLILVKLSITYYESWYLVPSFEKTYSKCSSLLSSSEPNSAWQASPWGHSPSSSAPCAVPMRLSRIDQHIKDEPLCDTTSVTWRFL